MNYIDLINHFWRLDDGAQFTGWETKLYFYLIKTANGLGWVNEFWHSDARVSANVGMSINTMKVSRNRLKQAGLIDFVPGGKGHGNKTRYQILPPKLWIKRETEARVPGNSAAGNQNLTPKPATLLRPSELVDEMEEVSDLKNNSTIAENTSAPKDAEQPEYVEANRKQAAGHSAGVFSKEQLKADLLNSEIGRMAAKNSEIKAEEYAAAVENFVETKFGLGKHKNWKDISSARENFVYWLPYYKSNMLNKDGKRNTQKTTGRQIVEQTSDDDSVVEPGADGVLRRISGKGVQTFAG